MGLSHLWALLAIGNHVAQRHLLLPFSTVTLLFWSVRMWEVNLTPGCCCSGSRGVSAGRSRRQPGGSFWLLLFSPCPPGWPASAECIDWTPEWPKFPTPGKARWLCCLWSNLVPISVGVLALAIGLFLESGKMPFLFWLLCFYGCAYRKFPLFSCWKHLPGPQTQLFPLLATSIVNKLTTVLNTYRFLSYPL